MEGSNSYTGSEHWMYMSKRTEIMSNSFILKGNILTPGQESMEVNCSLVNNHREYSIFVLVRNSNFIRYH